MFAFTTLPQGSRLHRIILISTLVVLVLVATIFLIVLHFNSDSLHSPPAIEPIKLVEEVGSTGSVVKPPNQVLVKGKYALSVVLKYLPIVSLSILTLILIVFFAAVVYYLSQPPPEVPAVPEVRRPVKPVSKDDYTVALVVVALFFILVLTAIFKEKDGS